MLMWACWCLRRLCFYITVHTFFSFTIKRNWNKYLLGAIWHNDGLWKRWTLPHTSFYHCQSSTTSPEHKFQLLGFLGKMLTFHFISAIPVKTEQNTFKKVHGNDFLLLIAKHVRWKPQILCILMKTEFSGRFKQVF